MNNNTEIELDEQLKELEKELTNNWILNSKKEFDPWERIESRNPHFVKFVKKEKLCNKK